MFDGIQSGESQCPTLAAFCFSCCVWDVVGVAVRWGSQTEGAGVALSHPVGPSASRPARKPTPSVCYIAHATPCWVLMSLGNNEGKIQEIKSTWCSGQFEKIDTTLRL